MEEFTVGQAVLSEEIDEGIILDAGINRDLSSVAGLMWSFFARIPCEERQEFTKKYGIGKILVITGADIPEVAVRPFKKTGYRCG